MGFFDSIFDLDRDGKTSFDEKVVGTALAAMMFDDAMAESERATALYSPVYTSGISDDADEYAWREEYEFDTTTDVDPEDYYTEEEYLAAVEEASWRDKYVLSTDTSVDADEHDTEEEYLAAVRENAWKQKYEYDADTGVDPDDYDTEEEYLEDLQYEREQLTEDEDEEDTIPYTRFGQTAVSAAPLAPAAEQTVTLKLRVCPSGKTWEEVDAQNEAVALRRGSLYERLLLAHMKQPHPDIPRLRQAVALYKKNLLEQGTPNLVDAFLVRLSDVDPKGEGLPVSILDTEGTIVIPWQDIPEERREILQRCVKASVGFRAMVRPELASKDAGLMCVEVYAV